jgi:sugar lactone lactonase YvrE
VIWVYDYQVETGTVSNKRVFVRMDEGHPDGLCIDRKGRIFVALFGASCVEIYSLRGEIIGKIELPVANVTSCALDGTENGAIFITTAFDGLTAEQRAGAPLSGQTFTVRLV